MDEFIIAIDGFHFGLNEIYGDSIKVHICLDDEREKNFSIRIISKLKALRILIKVVTLPQYINLIVPNIM